MKNQTTYFFSPQLLATAAEQFNYKMPYADYLGGVVAISWTHFQLINGLTNRFLLLETDPKKGKDQKLTTNKKSTIFELSS